MKKSEILALLFLLKNDLDSLKSLSDYVKQFNEIEKQFAGVMENMNEPNEQS